MCVCVCDALAQLHLYNTDSYKNASQGGSFCEPGTVSAVRGTSSELKSYRNKSLSPGEMSANVDFWADFRGERGVMSTASGCLEGVS